MGRFALLLLFFVGTAQGAYPGDDIKLKRESIMCRAFPYLVEADSLQRRGNQSGLDRFLNIGRCKQNSSTRKAKVIRYGQAEGRGDFLLVDVRGKEYWVRYSDIRT